jgi:hypothetical protein
MIGFYDFVGEYRELCLKYNLVISSCGCCNSPWVKEPDEYESIEHNVQHLKDEQGE